MASNTRSRTTSRKGYNEKVGRMKREGFTPPTSETGYGQSIMGMDDLDRIRREKLKK